MHKNGLTIEITKKVTIPEGIVIREFTKEDFSSIQKLYDKEGWMTFIKRSEDALEAFNNSTIALVAIKEKEIVGVVRGLTDGQITTYISEILVDRNCRGCGLGRALLDICHHLYPNTRLDVLASDEAYEFYESEGFRKSSGYRKSYR